LTSKERKTYAIKKATLIYWQCTWPISHGSKGQQLVTYQHEPRSACKHPNTHRNRTTIWPNSIYAYELV